MFPLKQSTAITWLFYVHDVNGDPVNSLTDGSFTKRISKNGAGFAAMTVTVSFLENGWYSLPLSAAHTDTLGALTIVLTNAGAKQVNLQFRIHARINDDFAYPAVSGRSSAIDASGRHLADLDTIKTQAVVASGGITFPAATLASTTNITAASGIAVSSLGANVITAASIAAAALNGKGDWNIGKTGYSLANGSIAAATFAAGAIDASAFAQGAADKVWLTAARTLTSAANITSTGGTITVATGAVTVGTNNDKTGYSLSQAFPANFAAMAITAGGALTVGTNNDKTGYSLAQAFPANFAALSITAGGLVDITQGAADKAWLTASRQLTGVQTFDNTGTWTGNLTGSVGSVVGAVTVGALAANVITAASIDAAALNGKGDWNIGKTGYSILATDKDTLVDLVWDEVLTAATHNVPDSAGRRLRTVQTGTTSFQGTLQGPQSVSVVRLDTSASATNDFYRPGLIVIESSFGTQFARIESYNGTNRDVTLATPLSTSPSSGDNVTILPWASVRVTNVDSEAIVDTSFSDAAANRLADHLLRRNYANTRAGSYGDAIVFRSPLGAAAKLVNRWVVSGATLSVYHEDDTTVFGTQAVTGAPGADPISSLDTN